VTIVSRKTDRQSDINAMVDRDFRSIFPDIVKSIGDQNNSVLLVVHSQVKNYLDGFVPDKLIVALKK
jgi:hypothetical protein